MPMSPEMERAVSEGRWCFECGRSGEYNDFCESITDAHGETMHVTYTKCRDCRTRVEI